MTSIDPDDLPTGTRLILVSADLFDMWTLRGPSCERVTVDWGERTPEGWYEPTFTIHMATVEIP